MIFSYFITLSPAFLAGDFHISVNYQTVTDRRGSNSTPVKGKSPGNIACFLGCFGNFGCFRSFGYIVILTKSFCVDGLTGFREAINAALPKSQIQRCIIHQIRSSTRYVSYKDLKALMADLKKVYQAINEEEAMNALLEFKEKWKSTYPCCVKSWEENWDILSTFFAYPDEIRRIIYITSILLRD